MDEGFSPNRQPGVTASERYLNRRARQTFLSLWSYPGVYRDQGGGKEICDLLVVFDQHILLFSDKYCQFPNTGNLERDWSRWFKRAVLKSAEQLWGAERWLMDFPNRVFINRECTIPLPLNIPGKQNAIVHRIAIAHGAADRCKAQYGGSGSLMLHTDIVGGQHYSKQDGGGLPFAVGILDHDKGFVHVLDDTSMDIVLGTVDTITDFISYLTKKEALIENGPVILASGEEDLLAHYLSNLNERGEHDFAIPKGIDMVALDESNWRAFETSTERQAQIQANDISYAWDGLIEKFNHHILTGTQYYTTVDDIGQSEILMRFLAREPRTRRRFLAEALVSLIINTPVENRGAIVIQPSREGDPYYVFVVLSRRHAMSEDEYRMVRRTLLEGYCLVTKLKCPDALDIIGVASEPGMMNADISEDAMYIDARDWTLEAEAEAKGWQAQMGLLSDNDWKIISVADYPPN